MGFSAGLTLWGATKGTKALMVALNIAYHESESRGFLRQNVFAVLCTAGAMFFMVVSIAMIAGIPAAVALLEPSGLIGRLILAAR